ncbi:MAG: hypothetical protein DMD88_17160, partial [Candidatus Rokuibacteriota bacterium]
MKTASEIILAGGNGERLRPLTRLLVGDDRPKPFCPVVGAETLLDQTRRRAATLVASDRTLIVVTREHEPFYGPALADLPARNVIAQPVGRGTAPAILFALLRLRTVAPGGAVAILPSDHDVVDDAAFMARVEGAIEAVAARPDTIVLLGVQPDRPESQYGWIEPDDVVLGPWSWPARPFSNISSVARCQPSPTRSARSVPSTLPPGKAKPPTSRTRASSPLISRAMSWSRVPSGSRCFRSPGPRRRTWATPRALASHARASGVSSDCGARGTTAFRCGRRRPA